MTIENVNLYDLVPKQIEELITKLNKTLEAVKIRKSTISKSVELEKDTILCPYCGGEHIIKYGHTKTGIQNFLCNTCNRKFNALTGTVFARTHLTYEQIEIFLQCYRDKLSIRKTANRMKVDKKTAHALRLKMNDSLKSMRKQTVLNGTVEADEMYKSVNLKGTKPDKMPRASKRRKSRKTTTQGISSHKVCIASAIDEHDNMFLEIVGNGPITTEMVKKALEPKIGKISQLTTDCKSSYESVAKTNNWNLIQIKSTGHIDDKGNSLANINSLHSDWSNFVARFRGVSTKHLQGYLDWFIFDKYMNYTAEDDAQVNLLFNKVSSMQCSIIEKNIYENHSCLDFAQIYADYNYVYQP